MIAQYTQAAMVAENRRLAAPASVDSLPTSAMQEDHVSMGWGAARKLRTALANLARILAIELTCAAHGRSTCARRCSPAPATGAALAALRARVAGPGPDRWLAPELAAAERAASRAARCSAAVEAVDRERWREAAPRPVRAPRGHRAHLPRAGRRRPRCGCCMNNLDPEVAERPDDLVVYGGTGRAARSWEAFDAIVAHAARRSTTTRRCSCSRASRSACSAPTSGRRGC